MAKVLLADDSGLLLKIARAMVEKAGHSAVTALNGKDAVAQARKEKPDVIILDAEMPEMTGIEACKVLKSDPDTRAIPVHIYTGNDLDAAAEAEFKNAGVVSCHTKPYKADVLLGLVPK